MPAPKKKIPDASLTLINGLAQRVRAARVAKGLPRRELSVRSGVSPRYLAQLEAGEGNISVVLLHRVASALSMRVEELLTESMPVDPDAARVAQLFHDAPAVLQGRVRALLAPKQPANPRAQRVCLIEWRGAGKSTLGALAADKMKVPFVVFDDEIAREAGMPVSEIAAVYGDDGVRAFETRALGQVIARQDKVIMAVDGDIETNSAVFDLLLARFHTIWVRTSPADHMARVRAQADLHTLDKTLAAMDQPKTSLASRTPLHSRALAEVDTTGKSVETSVDDLLAVIAKNGFLGNPEQA